MTTLLKLLRQVIDLLSKGLDRFQKMEEALARIENNQQIAHAQGLGIEILCEEILTAVTLPEVVSLDHVVELEGQILEGVTELRIKDNQKFTLTLRPKDAKGFPATPDGPPTFTSTNPNFASFAPSPDGDPLKVVVLGGSPGSTQINATVDADLGEGVRPIAMTPIDLEVTGGDVATLEPEVGAVEDQ